MVFFENAVSFYICINTKRAPKSSRQKPFKPFFQFRAGIFPRKPFTDMGQTYSYAPNEEEVRIINMAQEIMESNPQEGENESLPPTQEDTDIEEQESDNFDVCVGVFSDGPNCPSYVLVKFYRQESAFMIPVMDKSLHNLFKNTKRNNISFETEVELWENQKCMMLKVYQEKKKKKKKTLVFQRILCDMHYIAAQFLEPTLGN